MTIHVAILGIDGSGKSTVVAALPALLAGEVGCRAGSLGDDLIVSAPDRDLAGPGFEPDAIPLQHRLARVLRWLAKRTTRSRILYPPLKLGHLACQDAAAHWLARRYQLDVMISDGNLRLSAAARACNYARLQGCGFVSRGNGSSLPDAVVLLDVSPAEALNRIRARGAGADRHENLRDLAAARRGYLAAAEVYTRRRVDGRLLIMAVDGKNRGQVAGEVVEFVRGLARKTATGPEKNGQLHRSERVATAGSAAARLLNPRYTVGHLVLRAPHGAWREPLFLCSTAGRRLIKDGYSADVMRSIYDAGARDQTLAERVFMGYPLHRAVADRLEILTQLLEPELEKRLERAPTTIFTAPSGYADDLFRPLEAIAWRRMELLDRVRVVAADLDPDGRLERDLSCRAGRLGVSLRFERGDLTDPAFQERLAGSGPFDLALFVGLSSWLPKPSVLRHLRWLRSCLGPCGTLVTDCFSPAAHAVSGHLMGYSASYFTPVSYSVLLEACGFAAGTPLSGRGNHNHVWLLRR